MFRSFHSCRLFIATMLAGVALAGATGCRLILPDVSHQPVIHNPFPQLSKVAVAPFFNQSDEPTVDGRDFALAYYAELQAVPGFEVVPLGVTEEAIIRHQIDLSHPSGARQLAKVLGVDAVAIGSITDYSPYYPPRCGLRVEWYAANPGFHEIPPGYGLPWGTPDEEFIPGPLVFEAEMALARAQLATQSPACDHLPPPVESQPHSEAADADGAVALTAAEVDVEFSDSSDSIDGEELPAPGMPGNIIMPGNILATDTTGAIVADGAATGMLPRDWPDERGFIPPPPSPVRPPCVPNEGPVMTHTRIYQGNDSEFTEALASYYEFRDDARFGGWQTYLQRSNDFIRFCCHMHISEMLSARGGAGETRVVWRWPDCR